MAIAIKGSFTALTALLSIGAVSAATSASFLAAGPVLSVPEGTAAFGKAEAVGGAGDFDTVGACLATAELFMGAARELAPDTENPMGFDCMSVSLMKSFVKTYSSYSLLNIIQYFLQFFNTAN
jgi:hypothetical protein